MRIFASDVRTLLADGADRSALARALLSFAVKEMWECEAPEIVRSENGKPFFAGEENMHFSLSHSKNHILVAVSEYPVGADIETLRPVKKEYERLFSLEMLEQFGYFGGWTLREAVFKLRGKGSLRKMEIRREASGLITPGEGIACAIYAHDDCAVAAATWEDEFPSEIEWVEIEYFWQVSA